jgi:pyridoxal phosphate enzyme (YggS family)
MIETVDSVGLAEEIDRRAGLAGKVLPVLVEVNSGREPQKAGVPPEEVEALVRGMAGLSHIKVAGLMTMGPFEGDPENARPYFKDTRAVLDDLRSKAIPRVEMRYLSMGMSNSWRVAVEEGANLVRIGTGIFGSRTSL